MNQEQNKKPGMILVVDDEPDICEALQLALSMEGYVVKSAMDRNEALRAGEDEPPAVILLDYRMPGLDAADFIAQLRTKQIAAPVILMTAGKDPDVTAQHLGLQHFLAKPFELDAMLSLVKKCASMRDGSPGGGAGASAV